MTTAPHSYDIGDRVKLEATFADDDGSAVDPDAVHFGIRYPDGASTTYQYLVDGLLQRQELGFYSIELPVTMSGKHRYRWVATGPGGSVEEGYFWANLNAMAGDVP